MAERADPNLAANRPAPLIVNAPRSRRELAGDVSEELKERWNQLMLRLSEPPGSPHRNLREQIRDDIEFGVIRARYYHRYYPLQAVGAAAAGAFLLGIVLGLGSD